MSLEQAYSHCEAVARAGDRDRWLGSLFAPAALRPHLHALIAFEREMAQLRQVTRDPRAGEIRLAWWREALTGERPDEAQGNPVAVALLDTLAKARAPPHLIENAIVARQFDLYDDPFASTDDLEAYLGETRSGLVQIAALALADGRDVGAAETSGTCGVALGLVQLMRALIRPRPLAFVPRDVLARHGATPEDVRERRVSGGLTAALRELATLARRRLSEAEAGRAKLPKAVSPAYSGLATAPLWLDAIDRGVGRLFETSPDVAAWRRQWALWRWARRS